MDLPKIGIQELPPSEMAKDLASKFIDDLHALIARSLSIMMPLIGAHTTAEIVLTSLSIAGAKLELDADFEKGTFTAFSKMSVDEARRKKQAEGGK
jgi:hypothetical protein